MRDSMIRRSFVIRYFTFPPKLFSSRFEKEKDIFSIPVKCKAELSEKLDGANFQVFEAFTRNNKKLKSTSGKKIQAADKFY